MLTFYTTRMWKFQAVNNGILTRVVPWHSHNHTAPSYCQALRLAVSPLTKMVVW